MSSLKFNNLKISSRMTIGFALLLTLMLVLLIVGITNLSGMQRRLETIVHDNKVKIELAQEMRFLARHEAVIIRNILLLRDPAQREKEVARRSEAQKNYQTVEDRLVNMPHDESNKTLIARLVEGRQATRPLWDKVVQFGKENKPDAGIQFLITEVRKVQWKWLDTLDELEKAQSKIADESAEQADKAYRKAWNLLIGLGIAAIVFGMFIAVMITRSITRPIARFTRDVEKITQGDLTTMIASDTHDELGELGRQLNGMTDSFDKTIHSMLTSVTEVVHTVTVLKSRAAKTLEGAHSQSAQAAQIATAAEEMSQTITDISKNASDAAEASTDAKDTAEAGKDVTDTAMDKVQSVHKSTVDLSQRVTNLNKRVGEIGEIVITITSIADQTNLLALNAAIEAARAGEQGRGFAVVADEVRKLAERTIKSTSEISAKISAVQAESDETSRFMTVSSSEVTKARDFIANVGGSLKAVVGTVLKVNDQIARIATAVEEQSSASEDIAHNIEKTSDVARHMEAMSGEVMHEINGLIKIAEELRNASAAFRTKGGELMILDLAKSDHRIFMDKIGSCLSGETTLDPAKLADHRTCRFGKWYLTEGQDRCGSLHSFKEIDGPHAKIHAMAKDAVACNNSGDKNKAQKLYQEMESISDQISGLLDKIKLECRL